MRPGSPAETLLGRSRRFPFLILAAAVFHVAVTAAVFMIGKFGLMPGQFDQRGLGTFASDGFFYQNEVVELCGVLRNQGLIAWATSPTQLHVRLYSLPLALNGGNSFNILTIEPLNLIYYLAILILVFKLGEIVFNYRTGILAAGLVALWPSFLLHTTQLLRDPLLISAVLILLLTLTLGLKRESAWRHGVILGIAGTAAMMLIRIVRLPMWPLLWAIVGLAVLFLIVRLIRQRHFPVGNVVFAIMMVATLIITPRLQNAFQNQMTVKKQGVVVQRKLSEGPVEQEIANRRYGFELQYDPSGNPVPSVAGSDIDHGIHFNSMADIIRYVPRAVVVGFLAPFPSMWFNDGKQVGAGGRRLSGFETLMTYIIECLALFGMRRQRKNLAAWFLFLVVSMGTVAVGLVVSNIGTLYRVRYPFWAMLIILSAAAVDSLLVRKPVPGSTLRPAAEAHSESFPVDEVSLIPLDWN
jgi:hypothetical protein